MPVEIAKNKKSAKLICEICGTEKTYPSSSPAAPALTACEIAEETDGWAFDCGFFSMMLGHHVWCPECCQRNKNNQR